jgi:hypothetical protein
VGFESTIAMFERAKTVHALDRVAAVLALLHLFTNIFVLVEPVLYTISNLPFILLNTSLAINSWYG